MRADFLGQPFEDSDQIGTVLAAALSKPERTTIWAATAWGKQSGLSRIAGVLTQFRERGGDAEIILGVDEGGASKEGLDLALQLFDRAFVFQDPGARTFHPKFYVVDGPAEATAVVGSGNLTKGGLYTNYEAAVCLELDRAGGADEEVRADLRAYYERLKDLTDFCRPLSTDLLEDLMEDPGVSVMSERIVNRQRGARRRSQQSTVFGSTPVAGLRGAPLAELPALPDEEDDDDAAGVPEPVDISEERAIEESVDVLILEIPKNADHRTQLDVGQEFFQSFFGGVPGQAQQIRIQHVRLNGELAAIEERALFRTKSHNYRFEAAAGHGIPYPESGRPLGAFVQTADGVIRYHLLWPGAPGHAEVESVLTAHAGPPGRNMRRVTVASQDLVSAWPSEPLL